MGKDGQIAYSTSTDMKIWSPVEYVAVSGQKGTYGNPRLYFDGDRAALIYRRDDRATIRFATLTDDGLEFVDEVVSEAGWSDETRMLRDGDRWLSIVDAPNRKLKALTVTALFSGQE